MKQGPASVEFRGVVKRYGDVTAVDRVSFTIAPGELVTLLGPSGCGKTTTLRLIAGLEMATEGLIAIGGKDVTRLSAADRDVSMVFQSYALFPHMNVEENVAYGPRVQGVGKARAREMAMEKLMLVGLKGLENRAPSELSGGQQQRVAVARALVLEPQVLLFDEPLSNLDAKLRRRVREEIRELQLSLGLTVAYVTHDQEEALAVSDRIIVMSNARIAQIGTPRELYDAPANCFVADFMGDANLIPVEVAAHEGSWAKVLIGRREIRLAHRGILPGSAYVAIRPHHIAVVSGSGSDGDLEGRISKAAYVGDHMEYRVTLDEPRLELFAIAVDVATPLQKGSKVAVSFDPAGLVLIPSDRASIMERPSPADRP